MHTVGVNALLGRSDGVFVDIGGKDTEITVNVIVSAKFLQQHRKAVGFFPR